MFTHTHMSSTYLQDCPSSGHEGQYASKDVSNCETEEGKEDNKSNYNPNEQEKLEKSEQQLEICTELLSTHGHNLQFRGSPGSE